MPARSFKFLRKLKRTKIMNRYTSLLNDTAQLNDQHHQQMELLLPWFLTDSLEHNEWQQVEAHLRSCILCSGLLVGMEKPKLLNHPSKLSLWIFGISKPTQSLESEGWLSCAFALLQPEQRAVIELTFCYGMPYQDIARILNCPEDTVKKRLFNARKKLQIFAETQEN